MRRCACWGSARSSASIASRLRLSVRVAGRELLRRASAKPQAAKGFSMSENTKPASPRQALLGLFILVQIAFLFLANVLGFVQWFPTLEHDGANKLINRVAPRFAEKQGHAWQWG